MYEDSRPVQPEYDLPQWEAADGEVLIEVPKAQWFKLRCEASYWHSHYTRLKAREGELHAEIRELCKAKAPQLALEAKISKLQAQLACADDGVPGGVIKRLRRQCSKWQRRVEELNSQLKRLAAKNEQLAADNKRLKAHVVRLNRLVFGDKSEKTAKFVKQHAGDCVAEGSDGKARKKRSSKGHAKRRDASHLPVYGERHEVAEHRCRCDRCGLPFVANGYEESELIEIRVQAYRRRIVRERRRSTCQCDGGARQMVVAPAPDRLFAHTRYGVSVWALYLHERFAMQRTVGGICRFASAFGLSLSSATLVNRNQAFLDLFKGLYQALLQHISQALLVHGDETSWPVQHGGMVSGERCRGWLWMVGCEEAVVMHIDRYRSADAALALYGGFERHDEKQPVILVCDRYSVYTKLASTLGLTLQYCWAHLRRDFINVANARADLMDWSEQWINRIGNLYQLNDQRLKRYDAQLPVVEQDACFNAAQHHLACSVAEFFEQVACEAADLSCDSAKYQPLTSALNNQTSFSVFVEHPECAMDNNFAERSLRPSVIVRKLSLGSKSEVSAQLMSVMVSVFATLRLHGIGEYEWLVDYLGACAACGGKAPEDLSAWLPWEMDALRLERFQGGFAARPQAP